MSSNNETLGPAERIIQTILTFTDHLMHNRPGVLVADPSAPIGVRWTYATYRVEPRDGSALPKLPKGQKRPPIEDGVKVVYRLDKVGAKTNRVRVGLLGDDGMVREDRRVVAEYRAAGLYPEVAAWLYGQVASVWKIDNEFCARWASHAYAQEHRDLKVILAAFMLVQGRKGDPVREGDKVAFYDEDYRDVGEAMMLIEAAKKAKGAVATKDQTLHPRLLLRIHEVLSLPAVAQINRELGFGNSARKPFYGRWDKVVEKWLRHREENPKILEGLVRSGASSTVATLAKIVGYRPASQKFFAALRWKQIQSADGRRAVGIGEGVDAAESWAGLSEEQVCERIVATRPSFKRVTSLVPAEVGITRAVVAATIEVGGFSDKDLISYTPTLEELGLLDVQDVRERWERACRTAEDMRAANVALRVRGRELKEKLADAADAAVKTAVEEATRGIRVYVVVDRSGSMQGAIDAARSHIARFLQGIPLDRLHVSLFNTVGREVQIRHQSAAGVENAFRGVIADGGTHYSQGVVALQGHAPKDDEDSLMIFVGDEEDSHEHFAPTVRASGLRPMAFGLVRVCGAQSHGRGASVRNTAAQLGIPCFSIDEKTFADPYAIPRTIRALVASTPVSVANRVAATPARRTLVETILRTELLKKPAWAT